MTANGPILGKTYVAKVVPHDDPGKRRVTLEIQFTLRRYDNFNWCRVDLSAELTPGGYGQLEYLVFPGSIGIMQQLTKLLLSAKAVEHTDGLTYVDLGLLSKVLQKHGMVQCVYHPALGRYMPVVEWSANPVYEAVGTGDKILAASAEEATQKFLAIASKAAPWDYRGNWQPWMVAGAQTVCVAGTDSIEQPPAEVPVAGLALS